MKKTISIIVLMTALLTAIMFPVVAQADQVDYGELDAMALKMAAQTEQVQAADQFVRVYRNVLIFDENNYSGSYNLDLLQASMVAGGVTLSYDDASLEEREVEDWIAGIGFIALHALGYELGSEKYSLLTSVWQWLGRAWHCYWTAYVARVKATLVCIGSPIGTIAGLTSWLVGVVGIIIAAVGSATVGFWVAVAGTVAFIPVLVVCMIVAIHVFWVRLLQCLFL